MKPSATVPDGADLDVVVDHDDPGYASRAALKLAGALDALASDDAGRRLVGVDGAWCLDLGASTGGFTDVLLRRGAAHVVALDVGHGQLVPRLREDPRVTVVEGFNVRDLGPGDLDRSPDLIVGDLSFISLTLVLPAVASVLEPGAPALLMVKPQFEVGKDRLGTGGVVRDPALHVTAVLEVVAAGAEAGLHAGAVVPSPLPGPSGNREYFVAFVRGEHALADGARASARDAVTAAVAWTPDAEGVARPPVFAVAFGSEFTMEPTPAAATPMGADADAAQGASDEADPAAFPPTTFAGEDAEAAAPATPEGDAPEAAGSATAADAATFEAVDSDPLAPSSRTGGAP